MTSAALRWALLAAFALVPALRGDARADDRELRHDVAVDGAVTGAGAALWIGSELALRGLVQDCRWCDRAADGTDTLNGFDRGVRDALRWGSPGAADLASSIGGFVLAPLVAFGGDALVASYDRRARGFWVDALVIAESAVLAADLNEIVKIAVARERPYAHFGAADSSTIPAGANVSFFSGHTTLAFALASSAGTVCSLRGYRGAPVVWAAGMMVAAGTAYLRIAADQHYATDVLAAAVVGTAFGVGIPLVFHGVRSDRPPAAALHLVVGPQIGVAGIW